MTGRDIETQACFIIEQMLQAIPAVSDLRISYQMRGDNACPDILAEVEIEGPSKGSRTVPYTLLFEVKSNGQPRWARIAAVQLTRYVQQAHARGSREPTAFLLLPMYPKHPPLYYKGMATAILTLLVTGNSR